MACGTEEGSLPGMLGLEEEESHCGCSQGGTNNIKTRDFTSLHTLLRLGPSFPHVDDKDDLGASAWDL